MSKIRTELDQLIRKTAEESFDETLLPKELKSNLDRWKWGSYGWLSPASLIITATWHKYFYPQNDCCKIWAKDENGKPIEGGYSIRSEDEAITIPVLAKHDLCTNFCSPNSGMQGSRAIEKMRTLRRLNIDFDSAQKTVFDLKLFAQILNQTNDLTKEQAYQSLQYQILIAKRIQKKRIITNQSLLNETVDGFNLIRFTNNTSDPELTKCVVAACLDSIFSSSGMILEGVTDYKTAADARAQKPGDLSLRKDDKILVAVEVKDKTQTIDWNNIDRANKIILSNSDLCSFLFVLEKREATVTDVIQEMIRSEEFTKEPFNKISFFSLHDLYLLALIADSEKNIIRKAGVFLSQAPAVKPETKEKWIREAT